MVHFSKRIGKKKVLVVLFLSTCLLISNQAQIQPASAAYGFDTTEPWATVLQNDLGFTPATRSWLTLHVYVVRSDGSWMYFKANEIEGDWSRYWTVYVDGVQKWQEIHGSSFQSPAFYLGTLSAGRHEIKIEIYGGYWADHWELDWVKLGGGNYALIRVESSNGEFLVPESAREEHSGYYYDPDNAKIKVETTAMAPPHLIYEGSGLNSYVINTRVKGTSQNSVGFLGWFRLYLKEVKITLKARMIDNSNGDLRYLYLDTIKTAHSSEVNYNSLEWSISADISGESGGVGASFSLKRGDDLTHYDKSTDESGYGANGAWRTMGFVHYNLNTGANREICSDFTLKASSIAMGNLKFHNIQFHVNIWFKYQEYNTVFGYWTDPYWSGSSTKAYILGDGTGQTSDPGIYADTWITALPGTIDLN